MISNSVLESLAAHIEVSSATKPIGNYDLTRLGGRVMRDTCRNRPSMRPAPKWCGASRPPA
ncbi:MAG: hypothetical protein IPG50_34800 [Myxococcales bacterium]|nr:hypothetical protein [Myxococcales bacterium]